jgi:hypothetical protein
MRAKRLTARYPGQCSNCQRPIEPGQGIVCQRGRPAVHADCRTAQADQYNRDLHAGRIVAGPCWVCNAADGYFRHEGAATPVRCNECQAAIKAGPMPDPVDLRYEDDCARRCGL